MGDRRSTPLSARERYYKRRFRRMRRLAFASLLLTVFICASMAYPVFAPTSSLAGEYPVTASLDITQSAPQTPISTPEPVATKVAGEKTVIPLPTQGQIVPPSENNYLLYYTIAGDSLPVVSLHFGVDINDISSPQEVDPQGLIPPNQLLIIPNNLSETSSKTKLLPDSEITYSPSTIDFDINAFVDEAGGYLSTYEQWLQSTGWTSGADVIAMVARDYSVNPRLLLAYLEFNAGWVYDTPTDSTALIYPMGCIDDGKKDLYLQAAWFASNVMEGYYGWREGRRLVINFSDEQTLRIAPELNAGTVGLMNSFSYLYDFNEWAQKLYGEENFLTFYESMFDSPWIRAQSVEPLIPAYTVQPEMILPFEINKVWAFTGGPHAAWSAADVWAAIDFAPSSDKTGCHESNEWVVASMAGLVVRSGNGVVVIDQDGDGFEQTGWTMLYLHIATKDRVPLGTIVEVGDRIGHASCEGGRSTGTHVHLARRYNGEWVPADGPLPFTLSGWQAKAGVKPYQGWLIKDSEIIYANTASTYETQITRQD